MCEINMKQHWGLIFNPQRKILQHYFQTNYQIDMNIQKMYGPYCLFH